MNIRQIFIFLGLILSIYITILIIKNTPPIDPLIKIVGSMIIIFIPLNLTLEIIIYKFNLGFYKDYKLIAATAAFLSFLICSKLENYFKGGTEDEKYETIINNPHLPAMAIVSEITYIEETYYKYKHYPETWTLTYKFQLKDSTQFMGTKVFNKFPKWVVNDTLKIYYLEKNPHISIAVGLYKDI